ncbi:unnamed protein product [Merluccius merluccius]
MGGGGGTVRFSRVSVVAACSPRSEGSCGGCSPVACAPSSEEETRCKMGADLEADNPQALILLPCGRFPGNPFPVACDGAVSGGCNDTTRPIER